MQTAYSWTHASSAFALRIDMFWAPTCLEQSIQECEYHPSFFSDYQFLLVKFVIDDRIEAGPGVWKFNTSVLDDENYCSLVNSFWSFWLAHHTPEAFPSILDWWDQGRFYLREVTQTYSRSKEMHRRHHKSFLTRQMHRLQHLFEAGDSSAFSKLCEVQEELCGIALHEAKGAQVHAAAPCIPSVQDDMLSKLSRHLSKEERASCEGLLTLEECFAALSTDSL